MRRGLGTMTLALMGASLVSGCGIVNPSAEGDQDPLAPGTPVEVVYYVEGTATSVTVAVKGPKSPKLLYTRGVAVPLQTKQGDEGLRWTFKSGDEVLIQVSISKAGGVVTCRIESDGRLVAERSAEGPRSIALCQGRA
jgi:hypothetical protein